MIIAIFVILSLIVCFPLLGQEIDFNKADSDSNSEYFFSIKLSPGLLYGGAIGFGKDFIIKDTRQESIYNMHYNEGMIIEKVIVGGLYYQRNVFLKNNRVGLYGIANIGIDYAFVENCTNEKDEGFVPNFSIGAGYSFPITAKSFSRVEIDFGYKLYVSNLSFVINF